MSLVKPAICCPPGTYACTVPVTVKDKVVHVDLCIAGIVCGLNAAGLRTVASCCGHGQMPGSVVLEDGRHLVVFGSLEEGNRAVAATKKPRE